MSLPHVVVSLVCGKETCRALFAASFSAVVLRMRVASTSETLAKMNGRKQLTTTVPPAATVSVAASHFINSLFLLH